VKLDGHLPHFTCYYSSVKDVHLFFFFLWFDECVQVLYGSKGDAFVSCLGLYL